jgi:hypothetical protein
LSCLTISIEALKRGRRMPYEWAPSASAIKGKRDQSFSVAGSVPSSTPIHVSTSGPLFDSGVSKLCWAASLHFERNTWHGERRQRRELDRREFWGPFLRMDSCNYFENTCAGIAAQYSSPQM